MAAKKLLAYSRGRFRVVDDGVPDFGDKHAKELVDAPWKEKARMVNLWCQISRGLAKEEKRDNPGEIARKQGFLMAEQLGFRVVDASVSTDAPAH